MVINKITYEQLFPLAQYSNVRLGMEITLTEGDMIEDAYAKAKTIATESFERLFPQVEQAVTDFNTGEGIRPERVVGSMADEIKTCKDLKVLSTYKLLVRNKPDLQEIFDEKLLELSK